MLNVVVDDLLSSLTIGMIDVVVVDDRALLYIFYLGLFGLR